MNMLHCCVINDCPELIEILVKQHDVELDEVDVDGYSPLFYAVTQKSDECVGKLLRL